MVMIPLPVCLWVGNEVVTLTEDVVVSKAHAELLGIKSAIHKKAGKCEEM